MDLCQQIQHRYPTTTRIIRLCSRQIAMTIVQQPDEWLEKLSKEDSDGALHLPYWTYLWPSAIGLVNYLDQTGGLEGQHILEIGCGMGLAGILGCQQGGTVVFTDYEREALRFAQHNVAQNGSADRAFFVQMNWHTPCLKRRFSRILASDVVYEEKHWEPILALIQRYLTADGQAILSEPSRANASGFLELMSCHGFTYEKYTHEVSLGAHPSIISIYCMRWS